MRDPQAATQLCSFCPKLCRFSCPVSDADQNESTTPWGKMSAMKLVQESRLPMTAETMSLAYKCLSCRRSQAVCELDNPVSSTLLTFRVRAFRAGLAPAAVHAFSRRFQNHNNPYGRDLLQELRRRFPGEMREKKKIAYFPGCTEIAENPSMIQTTLELLRDLKIRDVGLYLEPIQCCGYPLFAAGDWDNFVELAEVNSHTLNDYSLILTGSPACLYTMETLYRSAGYRTSARFLSIVEFLKKPVAETNYRIKKNVRAKVAYHDPCYLGRYQRVYEAPRELIRRVSGMAPIEFPRNREGSYCCGGGGLLPVASKETAARITEMRLEEFRATGADLLVSSCPTCVRRFRKFSPRKGQVRNLVEYLKDGIDFV